MKAVFALAAIAACLPAMAHARPAARCFIRSAGETPYSGPCRFLPEAKGSFSVQPAVRRRFFPQIASVGVWLTGPGTAEVSGLTAAGINSRWGTARRSRRDPACWDGEDFRVCVYR